MKFEIDDYEYDASDTLPGAVQKIKEVLDELPDGKLYTVPHLAKVIKLSSQYLSRHVSHPSLATYKTVQVFNGTTHNLLGNPATIRAFTENTDEG